VGVGIGARVGIVVDLTIGRILHFVQDDRFYWCGAGEVPGVAPPAAQPRAKRSGKPFAQQISNRKSEKKESGERRVGAQERTRTSTALRPLEPESSASANSATWAQGIKVCPVGACFVNSARETACRRRRLLYNRLP
jgi:hypothetical protein